MSAPSLLRTAAVLAGLVAGAAAGPYSPGPSGPGSDALPAAAARFRAWASSVSSFQPGPREAGKATSPAAYGTPAATLGPPDAAGFSYPYSNGNSPQSSGPVLSLGDGGQATLTFPRAIADGEGPDFAVFENGFGTTGTQLFAELAFVEVSSDGQHFTRFPAVSCTQTDTQTGPYSALDPTCLYNLAGKYPAGYGTPFDLRELTGTPGLDLQHITHVRIVDVIGAVNNDLGSRDSAGNWINDPFPTSFASGGFDLDAVGVIHEAADPWQDWIASRFPAESRNDLSVIGPGADPDGDGRSNLLEYACASHPAERDTESPLTITSSGDSAVLTFHRAGPPGVSLQLEQSRHGQPWEPVAPGGGVTQTESGSLQTVTVPREASAVFRLRAIRIP